MHQYNPFMQHFPILVYLCILFHCSIQYYSPYQLSKIEFHCMLHNSGHHNPRQFRFDSSHRHSKLGLWTSSLKIIYYANYLKFTRANICIAEPCSTICVVQTMLTFLTLSTMQSTTVNICFILISHMITTCWN